MNQENLLISDDDDEWTPNMTLKLRCNCLKSDCFICSPPLVLPEEIPYIRNKSCCKCGDRSYSTFSSKKLLCVECNEDLVLENNKLIIASLERTLKGSATLKEQKSLMKKIKDLNEINFSIHTLRKLLKEF